MTEEERPTRPVDVDTGFWLWSAALPLFLTGYVIDLVASAAPGSTALVYALGAVFMIVMAVVVMTFLILMRHGYRWSRTVLTGGACASVVYVLTNLFTVERTAVVAVIYAFTAIVGSVLITGGMYLLHRPDAHEYFTR